MRSIRLKRATRSCSERAAGRRSSKANNGQPRKRGTAIVFYILTIHVYTCTGGFRHRLFDTQTNGIELQKGMQQ